MKYAFHVVDVFSATPFGGNQLAVLPDATGAAGAGLVGAMASKPDFTGATYRLTIRQGVSMGRRSELEVPPSALVSGDRAEEVA